MPATGTPMAAMGGRPCPAVGGTAGGGAVCASADAAITSIAAQLNSDLILRMLLLVDSAARPAYSPILIRGGEGSENNLKCGRIATVGNLLPGRWCGPAVRKRPTPLPPYQNRIILQINGLVSRLFAGSWKQRSYGDGSCKISKTKGLLTSERAVSLLFCESYAYFYFISRVKRIVVLCRD